MRFERVFEDAGLFQVPVPQVSPEASLCSCHAVRSRE